MAHPMTLTQDARALVARFALEPHPEGGYFRRTHASALQVDVGGRQRPALTAILFLLDAGQTSRWHCVDGEEAWHWQDGDALDLWTFDPQAGSARTQRLDTRERGGEPMAVVPAGWWQCAHAPSRHVLVACTVSPGFVWEGFQLVQPGSSLEQRLRATGAPPAALSHGTG